ncbi:uncharacterized protein LOC6570540 [Drosophila grimshawi]|uniref:GH24931 n=1 Tax=Drosophila grimshawi TaxID=7222 RepID=B4K0G4_DROGR|nr:uncharacterized protein LOC6570540 [Drosophila grimshawi]EDV95489.1 GH24931 [Drosophila grimshawi]
MADNRGEYKRERRKFSCLTYAVTATFLLLALLQWYLFHFVVEINSYFFQHAWIGIIFFVLSLVLILIFIFFEDLRFFTPGNWIFAFLIFECIVIGVTSLIVRHYKYHYLLSFIIWTLVLIIFLLIGTFLPRDLTLDVVVLVIIGIVCIIGAIYFLMLHIVANVPYSFFACRAFLVLSIVIFVMYHAQIINGGRFAEIRDKDYLLAALILFYDFLMMYLFTFQLAPKWSDDCDANKNVTSVLVVDSHLTKTTTSEMDRLADRISGDGD